jgi:hypothetical protein
MRPSASFLNEGKLDFGYVYWDCWTYFGELNENNEAHGRGIRIYNCDHILIGYWKDGECATGHYISISPDGGFSVGEKYKKDGEIRYRGTTYFEDGTEKKYDS